LGYLGNQGKFGVDGCAWAFPQKKPMDDYADALEHRGPAGMASLYVDLL
jgi:hypothetical protein